VSGAGLALVGAAVLVGAIVQGSIGFGLNLIAAPVLALVDPTLVPGPAIVIAFVFTALLAVRERRDIDLRGVRWALYGRVPGSVVGALAVAALSPRALSLGIAAAVIEAVAASASGASVTPTRTVLVGAGALSGVMGTASSIGGPPMAMALSGSTGAALRGTLSAYFLLGTLLSVALLAAVGEFGARDLEASAILLPPLLVGFALSRLVTPHVDGARLRTAVLVVSTLAAVSVVVSTLA
jgi:uncharacterized membrane protein YfcA